MYAGDQNQPEYWESIGKGQRIQCDHTLVVVGFFVDYFCPVVDFSWIFSRLKWILYQTDLATLVEAAD